MTSRARSFVYGLLLPAQAVRLIFSRKTLLFWSILPILLTVAVQGYIIFALQEGVKHALSSAFAHWGWSPTGLGAWLLSVLVKILLIVAGAVSFSFVAGVVASPFNDLLSEKAEKWATPPFALQKTVYPLLSRARIRILMIDLIKTILATTASLLALLVSWIPLLNVAAFVVVILLVCFQYISYPQTRRGQGVGYGLRFIERHLFACAGFGLTLTAAFTIPLISAFFLPVAVVGGTLLVARAEAHGHEMSPLR